jgi:riboflavin transporter
MSNSKSAFSSKFIAKVAIMGTLAFVVMFFDFPIPIAPAFYKIDFSEVIVLITGFALGPFAAVISELIKVILFFLVKGSMTGGVGEVANFLVGVAFVLPAVLIYQKHKSVKSAIIGLIVGTISLCVAGLLLNYYVLIPTYGAIMQLPIQVFIDMGAQINPLIKDLWTFVFLATTPFNLVKGVAVSVITMLLYKRISPILKK